MILLAVLFLFVVIWLDFSKSRESEKRFDVCSLKSENFCTMSHSHGYSKFIFRCHEAAVNVLCGSAAVFISRWIWPLKTGELDLQTRKRDADVDGNHDDQGWNTDVVLLIHIDHIVDHSVPFSLWSHVLTAGGSVLPSCWSPEVKVNLV